MNKMVLLGSRPTTVACLLGVQLLVLYLSYSQVEAGYCTSYRSCSRTVGYTATTRREHCLRIFGRRYCFPYYIYVTKYRVEYYPCEVSVCCPYYEGPTCDDFFCDPQCVHGTCTGPGQCTCDTGWRGSTCDIDINECVSTPNMCHENAICTNIPGSFYCTCNCGYEFGNDQWTCTDIDECDPAKERFQCESGQVLPECEHECVNTQGSFHCICPDGYEVAPDGYSCVDIPECERDIDGCDQHCNNTDGSYECSCDVGFLLANGDACVYGFRLAPDNHTCDDIDECTECFNAGCEQVCNNTFGGFYCDCGVGYKLAEDRFNCEDIDECAVHNGGCEHNCTNTIGSYYCSCNEGFELANNSHDCPDIPECEYKIDDCSDGCENLFGTYTCYCSSGYILVNGNECMNWRPNITMVENNQTRSLLAQVQCSQDNPCQCVMDKITTLSNSGFIHEVIQNGSITQASLNPARKLTAFDVLRGFMGDNITYALPVNTLAKTVMYNCSSDILTVITSPGGEITVFPYLMNLTKVQLTMAMSNLNSPSVAQVQMQGNWTIGRSHLVAFLTVDSTQDNMWTLNGGMFETEVDLRELLSVLNVDFPFPPSTTFSMSVSRIAGQYTTGSHIVLSFEGTIQAGDWFADEGCLVVYQSLHRLSADSSPHVALATACSGQLPNSENSNLLLSHFAQNILGLDVSSLSFFGSLQLQDVRMLMRSHDYSIPDNVLASTPLQNAVQQLKGTHAIGFVFTMDFQGGQKSVIVQFLDNTIDFSHATSDDLFTLQDFRNTVLDLSSTLPTFSLVGELDISDLSVQKFFLTVNSTSVSLEVQAAIGRAITVIEDVLIVQKPIVHFQYESESFTFVSSFIDGHFDLESTEIPATIRVDLPSDTYQVASEIERVSKEDLSESLRYTFPSELDTLGISSILAKAKLHISSAVERRKLCYVSSGAVFGEAITLAACIKYNDGATELVFGVELVQFSLSKVLSQFVGDVASRLIMFTQILDITMVYSNTMLDQSPFTTPLLSGLRHIRPGVTLYAIGTWPDGCSTDIFCQIMTFFLGNDIELHYKVYLYDGRYIRASAAVPDFSLGSLIQLSSASVEIEVTEYGTSRGVCGSQDFGDFVLSGCCKWRVPQFDVLLELRQEGCWEEALGLPFLEVCNLRLAVILKPSPIPGLQLEVLAKFGFPECNVLTVAAAVGFDPHDPTGNYIYLVTGPLTLENILQLFCVNIDLPEALAFLEFPNGVELSYSLIDRALPGLGVTIPAGLYFRGTMRFLGYQIHALINIDFMRSYFRIEAYFDPLKLANGLLVMYRSRDIRSQGPFVDIELQASPLHVSILASGYVSVLGISAEAMLRISNDGYDISLYGSLLGLFEAQVHLHASYGDPQRASFEVTAYLRNDFFDYIARKVRELGDAAKSFVDTVLRPFKEALKFADEAFGRAANALDAALKPLRYWRARFNAAAAEVARWRNQLSRLCQFRNCWRTRRFCFPCGGSCCFKTKSCCFSIRFPDLGCFAYNAICAAVRAPFEILLGIAELALRTVSYFFRLAEQAVALARDAFQAAQRAVRFAGDALDAAGRALGDVFKFAANVAAYVVGNLVNLQEVELSAGLSTARGGHFRARVKGVIIGIKVDFGISLYLYNPQALIDYIVDRVKGNIGLGRKRKRDTTIPSAIKPLR